MIHFQCGHLQILLRWTPLYNIYTDQMHQRCFRLVWRNKKIINLERKKPCHSLQN